MSKDKDLDEGRLGTLNRDGSRRKLYPTASAGRFLSGRRIAAYVLLAAFTLIPYFKVAGKPLVLLDLPARRFTIFGYTFLPTDTLLLMLLLVAIIIAIFLLTALFGRVWCGWACPQTVYLEFLFRPIERLIEGSPAKQRKADERGGNGMRRALKIVVFAVLSLFLAHTFLAYFVGVDQLILWVQRSPFDHPAAFMLMAGVSAAMFVDFAWFREQTCIVACPYGRLQSVLLDRQSLIVGYDTSRGEPRGRRRKAAVATAADLGDCIDCGLCVRTCPTGIDIRDGLQMECIGCAQCIDACDVIMDRVDKPRGLIRYSTQDELAGEPKKLLRPRVVIYPALLVAVVSLFVLSFSAKSDWEVSVRRGIGAPFTMLPGGKVSNQLRVRISNRSAKVQRYTVAVFDERGAKLAGAKMIIPVNPLPVAPSQIGVSTVFITAPKALFSDGLRRVLVEVRPQTGPRKRVKYSILGPSS